MYTVNGGRHDAPRYKNISRVEKLTRANHLYLKWDIFIRGNTLVFVPIDRIRPLRISTAAFDEDVGGGGGGGVVFNKTYYAFLASETSRHRKYRQPIVRFRVTKVATHFRRRVRNASQCWPIVSAGPTERSVSSVLTVRTKILFRFSI